MQGSLFKLPDLFPVQETEDGDDIAVVTQSLLAALVVFVYSRTLSFFLTRNLNHILFEILQKAAAMWLPFCKLSNKTVSSSQLCLKNNDLEHRPVLLRPRGQWPRQRRIRSKAGWPKPAFAKPRNPKVRAELPLPFLGGSICEFHSTALVNLTSVFSLPQGKRISRKMGVKTIPSMFIPDPRHCARTIIFRVNGSPPSHFHLCFFSSVTIVSCLCNSPNLLFSLLSLY